MNYLAIETSAEACSAALWSDGEVFERFAIAPRAHSELILTMLGDVLSEGGVARSNLDGVVFGRGPGSFTGVRIATGVAQGLSYALDLPVVPVSTLEILAQGVLREQGKDRVLVAFDARMGEVYWVPCAAGADGVMRAQGDELVCAPEAVPEAPGGQWVGAGSGWEAYNEVLSQIQKNRLTGIFAQVQCHARDALTLGVPRFIAGEVVDAAGALPVYLRNKVAWKKS